MQGSTNATTIVGSSGGAGATVTAVNKTGSIITAGSKVWLNDRAQTEDFSFALMNLNTSSAPKAGVLSRTGNVAYYYQELFSVKSGYAEIFNNAFQGEANNIKYGPDNSMFICYETRSYRIDDATQYTLQYRHIADDFFVDSNHNIVRLNIADGSIVETLGRISSTLTPYAIMKVLNGFCNIPSNSQLTKLYTFNGSGYDSRTLSIINPSSARLCPADVTYDGKYVICGTTDGVSNAINGNNLLRIVEVVDENTLKILAMSEMPLELQEFYDIPCNVVFNPYTGLLTVTAYNTDKYKVMKYEEGSWKPVTISLNIPEGKKLRGSMSLSDDLTRVCVNAGPVDKNNYTAYVFQTSATEGYAMVPYRYYNVNENTITGYISSDVGPDMETDVNIASAPVIDTAL